MWLCVYVLCLLSPYQLFHSISYLKGMRRVLVLLLLLAVCSAALCHATSASADDVLADELEHGIQSFSELATEAGAETEADAEAAAEVDAEADLGAESESAVGFHFFKEFGKDGKPKHGGGDEWTFETESIVVNMWGGIVIGNLAKGSRVIIERYIYHKDKHEEATYGWGYVAHGTEHFGGWYGGKSMEEGGKQHNEIIHCQ